MRFGASGAECKEKSRMRVAIIAGLLGTVGPRWAGPGARQGDVRHQLARRPGGGRLLIRLWSTAPTRNTGSTSPSCRAARASNGGMLLIAGKIEFFMGGDMIGDFLAVQNNIPTITVAADFQKNPQCLMSHPGVGLDKWEDLPNANPAFVSAGAINTFWAWMRRRLRLQGREHQALQLQLRAVHRRQAFDPAGLRHLRAVRGRAAGRVQAERLPARRLRLRHLLDPDHDPPGNRREEPRSGAALRQTPPRSAGIITSTATTPRPTPRSRKRTPR